MPLVITSRVARALLLASRWHAPCLVCHVYAHTGVGEPPSPRMKKIQKIKKG